jgi:transcriptional regulator with XRE-family HTH domain
MEPGSFIKSKRLAQKISQRQLAIRSGVSYVQINKYEKGKAQPSQKILEKIVLKGLKLPPESILEIYNARVPNDFFNTAAEIIKQPTINEDLRKALYYLIKIGLKNRL